MVDITGFDALLSVVATLYLGLTGLGYTEKLYKERAEKINSSFESIYSYFEVSNRILNKNLHYRVVNVACVSNLHRNLYPARIKELFYKAGIYCLLLLIFSGFSSLSSKISTSSLFSFSLLMFGDSLRLTWRMIFTFKRGKKCYDYLQDSKEEIDYRTILYPFKKYSKQGPFFQLLSARFVSAEYDRALTFRVFFFSIFLICSLYIPSSCVYIDSFLPCSIISFLPNILSRSWVVSFSLLLIIFPYILFALVDMKFYVQYNFFFRNVNRDFVREQRIVNLRKTFSILRVSTKFNDSKHTVIRKYQNFNYLKKILIILTKASLRLFIRILSIVIIWFLLLYIFGGIYVLFNVLSFLS